VKDSNHFAVTVKVGIAFVRGTFKFDFTLLEQTTPSHSKFEAIGKGAGVSVRLAAAMDLKEIAAAATELAWKSDVDFGGLLGEVSPNLIQGSTDKFTRQFFECIKSKLETHRET
jgi:carbon monoxide dehydrogenase subunit G